MLLPTELQVWMHAIAEAGEKGLSYEEALESMAGTEAEDAIEEWQEAVEYSETLRKASDVTWEEKGW